MVRVIRLWVDEATGYDCCVRYNERVGFWLGYVGVPVGHPWFERSYDTLNASGTCISLTFSDRFTPNELPKDAPAQAKDRWWVGFDRVHFWKDEDPLMEMEQACVCLTRQAAEVQAAIEQHQGGESSL